MSVKFKAAMPVGSVWLIEHTRDIVVHGNTGTTTIKPIGGKRTVAQHRSKDMGLTMSETGDPKRDGVVSWLSYPKSHFWQQNEDGSIDVMHSEGERVGTRLLRYVPVRD